MERPQSSARCAGPTCAVIHGRDRSTSRANGYLAFDHCADGIQNSKGLSLSELRYSLSIPASAVTKLQLHAFDIIALDGDDLRKLPIDSGDRNGGKRMTKFLIGVAVAAVFYSAFPRPVMARHVHSGPGHPAQSIFRATKEIGNPHHPYCDYMAWSYWRRIGAWDGSLDAACLRDPHFIPGECLILGTSAVMTTARLRRKCAPPASAAC